MANKLTKLTEKHKLIVLLRIRGLGYEQIANEVGCSVANVNKVLFDPLAIEFKKEILEERLQGAKDILLENAINAASTITNGCKDKHISIANVKCAEINLKMLGLEPAKKIDANINERVVIVDSIPEDEEGEE